MGNIEIHRYPYPTQTYGGYLEPDDKSWIIYLDMDGKPCVYWPERDESGAVVGEPLFL